MPIRFCTEDELAKNVANDIKRLFPIPGDAFALCCTWSLCNFNMTLAVLPQKPEESNESGSNSDDSGNSGNTETGLKAENPGLNNYINLLTPTQKSKTEKIQPKIALLFTNLILLLLYF